MKSHEIRGAGCYRFAGYELRPHTRELLADGVAVALGGRAFDLLTCLVAAGGRTVDKDELLAAAWPGRVVIDNNLNAQVRALRRQLGPQSVLTVPGRGFCLGWEVHENLPLLHGAGGQRVLPAVAVLPFDNLGTDPSDAVFASGVAEDILNALSRFRQFRVIARGSSFAIGGRDGGDVCRIGADLGARYLLRGSVRRSATGLRFGAQLLETVHGQQLWSESWEGAVDDLFRLQDAVAEKVAVSVHPAIERDEIDAVRRRRPDSLAAHELVLRALPHLYAMRPADNAAARALLLRALELDPTYAWAQAHAAWCYEQSLSRGWPDTEAAQGATAVALARHALAAGGDDAIVVGLAGFVLFAVGREDDTGLAALQRACTLNPNAALIANLAGTAQLFAGHPGKAVHQLERLRALSPSDPAAFLFLAALACAHLMTGQPQQALALGAEATAANPDWDFAWWVSAAAAGEAGDAARAAQALSHLRRIGPARLEFPRFRAFRDDRQREFLLQGLSKAGLRRD